MATLIGVVTTLSLKEGDAAGSGPLLTGPRGIAVDKDGNIIVADYCNHRIRRITPEGVVTTLTSVEAKEPLAVAIDSKNNIIFTTAKALWEIKQGAATMMAGGQTLFGDAAGLCLDEAGNIIVADTVKAHIKILTPATGAITCVLGKPGWSQQGFVNPSQVVRDPTGTLFVLDKHLIRKVTLLGEVSIWVGDSALGYKDGQGLMAAFSFPKGLVRDPTSGNIFVTDEQNACIRCVTPDGTVFTIAGSKVGKADGRGTEASFWAPYGIALGPDGSLYVTDVVSDTIRKITLEVIPQAGGRELAETLEEPTREPATIAEEVETKREPPSRGEETESVPPKDRKQPVRDVAKEARKKKAKTVEPAAPQGIVAGKTRNKIFLCVSFNH